MDFNSIIREERQYCAHLFRLLCHDKELGGDSSGLAGFLDLVEPAVQRNASEIRTAEIFTEVAALRDYYYYHPDQSRFLRELHRAILPILAQDYGDKITDPIGVEAFDLSRHHPGKFGRVVASRPAARDQDVLFYREFSALFNAKPDLLIICGGHMLWFEVKFWVPFDLRQLQRTKRIATLCSSTLFEEVFGGAPNEVFMLGTHRHRHARHAPHFIDWARVAQLAGRILPCGEENYSTRALKQMLALDAKRVAADHVRWHRRDRGGSTPSRAVDHDERVD